MSKYNLIIDVAAASAAFQNYTSRVPAEWESLITERSGLLPAAGKITVVSIISALLLWPRAVKVPVVTITNRFLFSNVTSKWSFMFNAPTIVSRGYEKVQPTSRLPTEPVA